MKSAHLSAWWLINQQYLWDLRLYLKIIDDHFEKDQKERGEEIEERYRNIFKILGDKVEKEHNNYSLNSEIIETVDDYEFGKAEVESLFSSDLPHFLYYSVIMMTYMIFETKMGEFCDILKEICHKEESMKFINIPGVPDRCKTPFFERAKYYVNTYLSLKNTNESFWEEMKTFSIVRNCIVHQDGDPTKLPHWQKDRLKSEENQKHGLILLEEIWKNETTWSPIIVTNQYCNHIIELLINYFGKEPN